MPGFHDFANDAPQSALDRPTRIVLLHLSKIAVVTDVIADAVLIQICVFLRLTGKFFDLAKGFENGTGVLFPASDVIDLR